MKKLIIILFTISIFASCSKDNDKTCTLSVTAVAGSYKITAVRYKATPASSEVDYYNLFFTDVCERDDIISLNAAGTYTFTDAGVKCVPPGDDSGLWSLSGNTVTVDGEASNVDSFSCSTLTVSSADVYSLGDKLILVLTRQ